MYRPKHKAVNTKLRRRLAIGFLVCIIVGLIACAIAVFTMKAEKKPRYSIPPIEGIQLRVETMPVITYTQPPTEKPTDKPTEKPTEAPTELETEEQTAPATESPTEVVVETESPTEPPEEEPEYSYLLEIDNPDYDYVPYMIHLNDYERELAAKIIMREFGDGGFTACCLQAQALRDAMIKHNYTLEEVYHDYQYDYYGIDYEPNDNCYAAIDYIFENGGLAVPHRILVMYSTYYANSEWHESQNFVVEYGYVRYFDTWW